MTYRLTRRARQEVLHIWNYIADRSEEAAADRFVDLLTQYFAILGGNPHAGRRRDDLRPNYRSFPVAEFLIFYRIREPGIQVLHVMHGRRDIATLLRH